MKITSLSCWLLEMQLAEPYEIAYESISSCANLVMKVDTDAGLTGWGCAAPDLAVTGETPQGVLLDFNNTLEPLLKGMDTFRCGWIDEQLQQLLPRSSSARAMADMAMHDLMARQAGVPLCRLLGGYRERIPTSVTIGILPVEATLEKARELVGQGFFILKIKGGRQLEEDVEKIIRLRELLGPGVALRFDANQGYTVGQSIRFAAETLEAGIEMLEQPTPATAPVLLGEVSSRAPVPVMADESLCSLQDAFQLCSRGWVGLVNIKLMKTGGIAEALRINSVARAAGVAAMVGCMDESALGIAAGLHFALGQPNVRYADLDGHLGLEGDPFSGLVNLEDGVLWPVEGNGLGDVRL